ncbi:DUF3153 domain-containing protein [Prochlorococcus sp. MIT 1307]|uniref:DUF3153 domain-containing protein n=1 Tax=Prochlorococcus sp. MIT 1307 TaxID=3096219 RepID=UPI002A74BB30|nr:DUF3153 domain-containing protein [Prochlorococcus sp. MIT 1307]
MDSALAFAEAALERGDYSQCLIALEELAQKQPLNSQEGPKIRMLMITALMGKGDNEKAISMCRELTHCKDNELRQMSKQLLEVLESPSLGRPANWSIQLPTLDLTTQTKGNYYSTNKKSNDSETSPLPPTGETSGLDFGFSILTLFVIAALTILLSGCVEITTKVDISGPDRIKLGWEIKSNTKQLLPWQLEFENALKERHSKGEVVSFREGGQKIRTPILRSEEASLILQETFSTAAKSAGFEITPPILSLKEKNWFIGVQQEFKLVVNLEDLPEIPGLKLLVNIHSIDKAKLIGSPSLPILEGDHVKWPMKQGEVNTLKFRQWRWNHLGLGTIFVTMLLGLNLVLQRIRLNMGFGFPELPP